MFQLPQSEIASPEKILAICQEVEAFIHDPYRTDVAHEVEQRAQKLEQYMALTGKMLADAKYRLESLLHSTFLEAVKQAEQSRMATSTLNKYLDVLTKDYNYLVTYADRMNRACTHSLDFMKGLTFKFGQEIKASMYSK